MSDKMTISRLESQYMTREPGTTVFILDDFDLTFSESELAEIRRLWVDGHTTIQIANGINRNENEVFLAVFHLSMKNRHNRKDNIVMRVPQLRGDGDESRTG